MLEEQSYLICKGLIPHAPTDPFGTLIILSYQDLDAKLIILAFVTVWLNRGIAEHPFEYIVTAMSE